MKVADGGIVDLIVEVVEGGIVDDGGLVVVNGRFDVSDVDMIVVVGGLGRGFVVVGFVVVFVAFGIVVRNVVIVDGLDVEVPMLVGTDVLGVKSVCCVKTVLGSVVIIVLAVDFSDIME